jgi:hypothetical protein
MSAVNNYSRSLAKRFGLTRENNAKTRNGYSVYYRKGFFGGKTYYRVSNNRKIYVNPANIVRTRRNNKKPNRSLNNNRGNLQYIN